jgi:hypothetical protein
MAHAAASACNCADTDKCMGIPKKGGIGVVAVGPAADCAGRCVWGTTASKISPAPSQSLAVSAWIKIKCGVEARGRGVLVRAVP